MQNPHYVIVRGDRGSKVEHPTLEHATTEAQRLASLYPWRTVYVLSVSHEIQATAEPPISAPVDPAKVHAPKQSPVVKIKRRRAFEEATGAAK